MHAPMRRCEDHIEAGLRRQVTALAARRLGVAWVVVAILLVTGASAQIVPPAAFELRPPLTEYAAFSCQALIVDGNSAGQLRGAAGGQPPDQPRPRAGQPRHHRQGQRQGDRQRHLRPRAPRSFCRATATVSGATSPATRFWTAIPSTSSPSRPSSWRPTTTPSSRAPTKNKVVLGGADGREFSVAANDTLALPAGTYLFSKMTVPANAKVTLARHRHAFCASATVNISANGEVNAAGQPVPPAAVGVRHPGRASTPTPRCTATSTPPTRR